jgi:phage gpG-like protein
VSEYVTYLEADWVGDDEAVQALMKVEEYIENMDKNPMEAARRIAMDDMQQHFDQEVDPEGEDWWELSGLYAAKKAEAGYPEDILHRTGALERAATSREAWIINDDPDEAELLFDMGQMPETKTGHNVGWLHQVGSRGKPGISTSKQEKAIRSGLLARAKREGVPASKVYQALSSRESSGNLGLPARPFVGLSQSAQNQISAFFDIWFDETEQVYVRASGIVQQRDSGKWGKRLFPDFENF